jgi:hypothetical protein
MRKQGRRCQQLVDEIMETRKYHNSKEDVVDCSLWRTHFGTGYGMVIRQVM